MRKTMLKPRKKAAPKRFSGLPFGVGAMCIRHGSWWLSYLNAEGRRIQENTGTKDAGYARRLLAERALDRIDALQQILRAVVAGTDNAGRTDTGKREVGTGRRRGTSKAGGPSEVSRTGRKGGA